MNSYLSEDHLTQIKRLLAAAREGALVVEHTMPGVLEMSGDTSHDLLNRMSTNDLSNLATNTIRQSILTTAHARIIDRIWVLELNGSTKVLTSHAQEEKVLSWLSKHIFFQDDVHVSRGEEGWSLWDVLGPEAQRVLSSAFPDFHKPNENSLVAGDAVIYWSIQRPVPGIRLFLHPHLVSSLHEVIGEDYDYTQAGEAYEILRIRAGIPRSPNEINEEYIPLEVGLWDAVSFSKGCYTGQEIIARMESRGKLARQISGVNLKGYAPPGSPIRQGVRLLGPLTSITHSPDDGWIGLGVIKPSTDSQSNGVLLVGEENVQAEIMEFSPVYPRV